MRRKTMFNMTDYINLKNDMSDTRADCSLEEFINIFEVKGLEWFYIHELRFIIYYMRSHKGLTKIPISGNKDTLLAKCNKYVYMTDYKSKEIELKQQMRVRKSHSQMKNKLIKNPQHYEDRITKLIQQLCQSLNQPAISERGLA